MKIYENDQIYVRPLTKEDTEKSRFTGWFFDQEVCKYNSHGKMSHGIDYSDLKFNPDNSIHWAVIRKPNTEIGNGSPYTSLDFHIGNIALNIDWINRNAEFTCIFGEKEYWGKGYCTQALKWIIAHGKHKLNLHKIWLGTANPAMMKVAENIGMIYEATLLDAVFLNGKFKDIKRYKF